MSEQLQQMQAIGMMVAGVHRKPRKFKVSANQFYPHQIERKAAQWLGKFFYEYGKNAASEELANQGITLDEDLFGNIDPNGSEDALKSFAEELFNQTQKHSTLVHQNFFVKLKIQNMGVAGSNDLKKDFVNRFVTNCKTSMEQQKRDIANTIYGFKTSRGTQIPLSKQIQAINENYSDTKAKFIARNEVANLNELISRSQAEESGFSCYEWLATHDMATRESHAAMDGLICRYDDSSVYSDDGGKTWKKRTAGMYHGAPGTDYNCRCCGAPYDRELYQEEKEPTEEEKAEEDLQKAEREATEAEAEVKQARNRAERANNSLRNLSEKMYTKQMNAGVQKFFQSLKKEMPSGDVEKAYQKTKAFAKQVRQSIKSYAIKKSLKERKLTEVKAIELRIDKIFAYYKQSINQKDNALINDETIYKTERITLENFEEEFEKLKQALKIPFSENAKNNFRMAVKFHPNSEWEWQDDGFFVETYKIPKKYENREQKKYIKEYSTSVKLAKYGCSVVIISDKSVQEGVSIADAFVNGKSCDLKKVDNEIDLKPILRSAERGFRDAIHKKNAYSAAIEINTTFKIKQENINDVFNKLQGAITIEDGEREVFIIINNVLYKKKLKK